jgi:microcin C transport system substrate-binding protein
VHASWWHKVSEDRKDPSNSLVYGQFDEPTIVDERTIKVTTKKMNWRLFLYFGGIQVMPEQYVKISGDEYIRKYDWEFIPGSGPYVMDMDQLKKGESLEMVRRSDWWAEEHDVKWARNTYNFHRIKCVVVRDRELLYEKFKADEFDHFRVGRAQRWVEEIPKEKIVQNGWVKRRKIFNQAPNGFSGIVFNMRKPPFNDKNVRLAFAHLFNREKLIDKLFFNQYEMIDSYFPGRDWGNADKNKKIRFDPQMAEEYLFDAGYMDRDDDGFLIGPDGKRLSITLVYGAPSWQRIWLVVKEDYEKAGIELKLKEIDYATLLKNIGERNFSIHFQSWGALLFPQPAHELAVRPRRQDAQQQHPGLQERRSRQAPRALRRDLRSPKAERDHAQDRRAGLPGASLRSRLVCQLPARPLLGSLRPPREVVVAYRRRPR